MAFHNSVFSQFLQLVPRHDFEKLAQDHHRGQRFRRTSRWSQFVSFACAHLTGRQSLRDLVENLHSQSHHLYHLGSPPVRRSTLARLNQQQSYTLYEALFTKLYTRCQSLAPNHKFKFKNKLYSFDGTLMELTLRVFPWSHFSHAKGAVKLHVGLDHQGYLPAFAAVTTTKTSELAVIKRQPFPPGSIVVVDRNFREFAWFRQCVEDEMYFVTRIWRHAAYKVLLKQRVPSGTGVTSDCLIEFNGYESKLLHPPNLRLIGYRCPETGRHYKFLTNLFHLSAKTICDLYKERWQIELFFKWMKQNLKIKTFLGTSKNAVFTQIWIALCVMLLLAYLKYQAKIGLTYKQILRRLQINLFVRRNLQDLLKPKPPDPTSQIQGTLL